MAPTHRRFFTTMAAQFQNNLIIPEHFMERFEGRLGSSCILQGPSGNEWWVHIRRARGSTSFSEGWSGFVADHQVRLGDLLVFTYTGNSSFKVSILNPATWIERPSALLAHNSSSSPPSSTVHETDEDHDDNVVNIEESDDEVDVPNSVSDGLFGGDQGQARLSELRATRAQTQAGRGNNTTPTGPASQARPGPSNRNCAGPSRGKGPGPTRTTLPGSGQPQTFYTSNRRSVTREEIKEAEKFADIYMCHNNNHFPKFKLILLPTNVYCGAYLTINKSWALNNMIQRDHDVELRVPGVPGRWTVGCRWSSGGNNQCQFRPRWRKFVLDNNLEEHDACVFELIRSDQGENGNEDIEVFNVHIFRVVEPAVPLTVVRRRM